MLKKISGIVALFAFSLNVYLAGLYRGFYIPLPRFELSESGFAGDFYFHISFFLLVFILGRLAKNRLLSNIICLSTLSLIIYQYKYIYYKTLLSDEGGPFSLILRESIPLDLISFSLVLFLLIYQIITVFQNCLEWKRNNAKVK